jgi:subtilisin family serine protease
MALPRNTGDTNKDESRSRRRRRGANRVAARKMLVERLESRVVLSSLPGYEWLGASCTPWPEPPVQPNAERNTSVYGPVRPGHWQPADLLGGSVEAELVALLPQKPLPQKVPRDFDLLTAPAMRGLDAISASVASAIVNAWELPVGSQSDAWVIGLLDDQLTGVLDAFGFETVNATPHLPNTFIAELTSPVDVAIWGHDVAALEAVGFVYPMMPLMVSTTAIPNDPRFGDQWHLLNTKQTGGTIGADANVVDVWDSYTGQGVAIAILDDAVQHVHPDLNPNYNPSLSYDFVSNDPDPSPASSSERHGTAVAGVAAGRGNNGIGISGAAPAADLAGIRLLGA